MDATDLMHALHTKEFRPVEIHLADGRSLRVDHPDYFLLFPTKKSALVFLDGVHSELVDVESIERVVPAAAGCPRPPQAAPPRSSPSPFPHASSAAADGEWRASWLLSARGPRVQPLQPALHLLRTERPTQMRQPADDFADRVSLLRKKHDPRVSPTIREPAGVQRRIVANVVRHDRRALLRGVLQLRFVVHSHDADLVRRPHLNAVLAQGGRESGGLAIFVEMVAQQAHAG